MTAPRRVSGDEASGKDPRVQPRTTTGGREGESLSLMHPPVSAHPERRVRRRWAVLGGAMLVALAAVAAAGGLFLPGFAALAAGGVLLLLPPTAPHERVRRPRLAEGGRRAGLVLVRAGRLTIRAGAVGARVAARAGAAAGTTAGRGAARGATWSAAASVRGARIGAAGARRAGRGARIGAAGARRAAAAVAVAAAVWLPVLARRLKLLALRAERQRLLLSFDRAVESGRLERAARACAAASAIEGRIGAPNAAAQAHAVHWKDVPPRPGRLRGRRTRQPVRLRGREPLRARRP
jgi:hypothetical protein